MIRPCTTAESFAETKFELPDGGRGCELHAGEVVQFEQSSREHGTIVLNLSKALAEYQERNPEGYACFELGLVVARAPDTVLCPAISYFVSGNRWAELDNVITESVPAAVVDVISSPSRRTRWADRQKLLLDYGVGVLIGIDPRRRLVRVSQPGQPEMTLGNEDELASQLEWKVAGTEQVVLPGFRIAVANLFREPEWMTEPWASDKPEETDD